MEKMRVELSIEGHDVQFITINKADAADKQDKLIERCSFPLFQDTDEINVWEMHNGKKDDFYIYDRNGILQAHHPVSGELSMVLSDPIGYGNLKDSILNVLRIQ